MSTTTSANSAPQKSNIRKLAELIYNTGNADRIMAALKIVLAAGAGDTLRSMEQEGVK